MLLSISATCAIYRTLLESDQSKPMIQDLQIERILNLQEPNDRAALLSAAVQLPWLVQLIEENIGHVLNYFKDPQWFRVYSGGHIGVNVPNRTGFGIDVSRLMQLGGSLHRLSGIAGFNELLANLQNPTQIKATVFEVSAADWCLQRAIHKDLTLYPKVTVNGKRKVPEFLWQTTIGDIYGECKTTNFSESKFNSRLHEISARVESQYDKYVSWQKTRLEVTVSSLRGNADRSIMAVVDQAAEAIQKGNWRGITFQDGFISAEVKERSIDWEVPEEYAHVSQAKIEESGVAMPIIHARFTIRLPADKYRQEAVAGAMRDARTQLPPPHPSAVFIEADRCTKAMQDRLLRLIVDPAYAHVQWASLWVYGQCQWAGWKEGQPFQRSVIDQSSGSKLL
jgi:hypothetical protein